MPRRPPRSPRWLPNPAWLTASLVLMLAVAGPVAYLAMPGVYRWHRLNQITADDPATRERALNYVIRHAGDDAAVRDGAIRRLGRVDQRERFTQLVNALDHAGVWSRRHVPDAPWLRWIDQLARAPEPAARRAAAQRLAAMTDLANEPEVWTLLAELLDDSDEPAVRHEALHSASLLSAHVDPGRIDAARFMAPRLRDRSSAVARDAWIVFALNGWAIDHQANWRDAPPELAEAILWTALKLNPNQPGVALDALRDPDAPGAARAMAAHALRFAESDAARRALYDLLARRPIPREADPPRRTLQRAILATPLSNASDANESRTEGDHLLDRLDGDLEALLADGHAGVTPLLAATRFRAPPSARDRLAELLEARRERPVLALALLEGLPVGERDLPITRADPAMLRLVAVARTTRTAQPHIEVIEDLFSHERSPMRDLTCVVARDRLDDDSLEAWAERLLTDLNPDARLSGAILAGLAGAHDELLRELIELEDVWRVRTLMRVGLWMQGAAPEMSERMPGLLMREDLPMSTLLLAMLHRGDVAAWDFLLAPHGEPAPDLHRLLTHYRWWHVLSRYLPDDAPPLSLWADAELQRFQIDVLRNWYRLNRRDLTRPPHGP